MFAFLKRIFRKKLKLPHCFDGSIVEVDYDSGKECGRWCRGNPDSTVCQKCGWRYFNRFYTTNSTGGNHDN